MINILLPRQREFIGRQHAGLSMGLREQVVFPRAVRREVLYSRFSPLRLAGHPMRRGHVLAIPALHYPANGLVAAREGFCFLLSLSFIRP